MKNGLHVAINIPYVGLPEDSVESLSLFETEEPHKSLAVGFLQPRYAT